MTSFPLNCRGGGHIDIKGSSNQHLAPAARSQPLHMSPRGDCHRHVAQRLRNRASCSRPAPESKVARVGRGVSRGQHSGVSSHTPHTCQQWWSTTHQKVSQHGMTTSRTLPHPRARAIFAKASKTSLDARGELASPRRHVQTLSGKGSGCSRPSPEKATASAFTNSSRLIRGAAPL